MKLITASVRFIRFVPRTLILQPLIVVHIGAIIEENLTVMINLKQRTLTVIVTWSVLHFSTQHPTAVAHIVAITDEPFTTTVKFPVKIQISLQPYNGCPRKFYGLLTAVESLCMVNDFHSLPLGDPFMDVILTAPSPMDINAYIIKGQGAAQVERWEAKRVRTEQVACSYPRNQPLRDCTDTVAVNVHNGYYFRGLWTGGSSPIHRVGTATPAESRVCMKNYDYIM